MVRSGHPQKQAVAASLSNARKDKGKSKSKGKSKPKSKAGKHVGYYGSLK